MEYGLSQKLGAILYDLPRFEWWLNHDWIRICNRTEILNAAPDGLGARCCWQWTSDLHLAKVFPSIGRRLLRRALHARPIRFAETQTVVGSEVKVSFVIGHRSLARLPTLQATLRTIAAQKSVQKIGYGAV